MMQEMKSEEMYAQNTEHEEIMESEIEHFDDIEKLQEFGINMSDISKLKSAGINTCQGVRMRTVKALTEIKGITEAKVTKIFDAIGKVITSGFQTGTEVQQCRQNVLKISTGSKNLDELLGGGLESMSITEVFGEFRTGKTQLCHTAAVTAQLPSNMGGGNGKVIWIDTEGTFRPNRIVSVAERFEVDPAAVLDNISVARAYTHEHQMHLVTQAAAQMNDEHCSLLIVDSVMALFRSDFSGRGQLAERQQRLNKHLSQLTKLANEYNIAILLTNQVTADPGANAMFVADAKKPIGGHIMAHACTTRLYLRKGRGETRICKIYDSPCLPEADAMFQLTNGGVDNPSE